MRLYIVLPFASHTHFYHGPLIMKNKKTIMKIIKAVWTSTPWMNMEKLTMFVQDME